MKENVLDVLMYLFQNFIEEDLDTDTDRAAMRLHDIGIQIVRNSAGALGAAFYVGGGMGRTPMIAPCINSFVPLDQFITYAEACLRVYNRYGRRDNKYKARIKILVHELGKDEYTRQVEAEFAHLLSQNIEPPLAELERIKAQFVDPPFETGLSDEIDRSDPDFALWVDNNTVAHKAPGYAVAVISLKPVGAIPGDASADQIRVMADLAERYSFDELRVTHAQNIVLPHVRKADLYALWQVLDANGLATANLDQIGDIIACPGLDYCTLANARSIPIAQKISERMAAKEQEIGELKLKISGCINACGHHHAGHIGILGVDRKGVENYQLLLEFLSLEDALRFRDSYNNRNYYGYFFMKIQFTKKTFLNINPQSELECDFQQQPSSGQPANDENAEICERPVRKPLVYKNVTCSIADLDAFPADRRRPAALSRTRTAQGGWRRRAVRCAAARRRC